MDAGVKLSPGPPPRSGKHLPRRNDDMPSQGYPTEFRMEAVKALETSTYAEVAAKFGVSPTTLWNWKSATKETSPKKFVFKKPTPPPSPLALPTRREPKEPKVVEPPPAPQPTPADVMPCVYSQALDRVRPLNIGYKGTGPNYSVIIKGLFSKLTRGNGDEFVYLTFRDKVMADLFEVISPWNPGHEYIAICVPVMERTTATAHVHGNWHGTKFVATRIEMKYFNRFYSVEFRPSTP